MTEIETDSQLNHSQRRKRRLAGPSFDVDRLPNPVIETDTGRQLPMRLRYATDIYCKVFHHEKNSAGMTSRLARCRRQYGCAMDAERELLDQMDGPSVIFLSLRQSATRTVDGEREWVRPIRLCMELNQSWGTITQMLRRKLSDYRYEYVRTTGYTDKSASPHFHVIVYVEDPGNQVQPDVGQSVVDSFVRGNEFACRENHTVNSDERDASILKHQIPLVDMNSTFLKYSLAQNPHWILSKIDNESSVDPTKIDAGTISWSSPHRDYSSSRGFPD